MANFFHDPDTNNTAATKTVTGASGVRREITAVQWSYSAAPTAGALTIESPSGTVIFKMHIAAAGPGQLNFDSASKLGALSQDVIVTLAAAGAVKGTLGFDTR